MLINDPHNTAAWAIETKDNLLLMRRTLPYGQNLGTQSAGWASSRGFVGGTLDAASGLSHRPTQRDPSPGRRSA
ncbi:MAG: hypothetical protein ACT4P1_12035 [Sporichthyaceae bacterium]